MTKYALFAGYKARVIELVWWNFKITRKDDNTVESINFECRETLFPLIQHLHRLGHRKAARAVKDIWNGMNDVTDQWTTTGTPKPSPQQMDKLHSKWQKTAGNLQPSLRALVWPFKKRVKPQGPEPDTPPES